MSGVNLFLSYASEDEALAEKLKKHIQTFLHQGLLAHCYDHKIEPGLPVNTIREQHLSDSTLILLLVSSDFLSSEYCYGTEMRLAMDRYNNGTTHVVPILLKPVLWEGAPFAQLAPLPGNSIAVTSWQNQDEAFLDIAKGLRPLLKKQPTAPLSQPAPFSGSVPTPIFMLPFRRDPFFTGREEILTRLYDMLQTADPIAITQPPAINGLGGIGKTQTAIEYAYRHRDEYQHILWVRSATPQELLTDYIRIAELLQLPEWQATESTIIVAAVKRWLETNTGWLLVFDNVEELEPLAEYLPNTPKGHILLTTRMQSPTPLARPLDLKEMTLDEGVTLLLRRAGLLERTAPLSQLKQEDIDLAQQIVRELDRLPLALNQAGAYIEERKCTLARYLALYQTHRTQLLKYRGAQAELYGHPDPVAITWKLSFKRLKKNSPAAELLRLCAFLAPDAIPEELFSEGAEFLGPTLASTVTDDFAFDSVLSELLKYSLIRRDPDTCVLTMHRLVQTVLKDETSKEVQHRWAECVVKMIYAAFPRPDFENWEQCERLLPQVYNALALVKLTNLQIEQTAWLFNALGVYIDLRYDLFQEAETHYEHAFAIYKIVSSEEHPNILMTLDNLAGVYGKQGKYEEAEALHERVRVISERVLGKEHPDTLTILNNLALVYGKQGKYEEAEGLHERVRVIRERVLGKEHPDTLTTLNNLALVYGEQGKYEEAEALHERVRGISERVLGKEHPNTLTTLHSLAWVYGNQGKYEEAEALYEQVRGISERVLGAEHPHLGVTLFNLARIYMIRGRYMDAKELYQRVLEIDERVYGLIHPEIIVDLQALMEVSMAQDEQQQVERLQERIRMIQEQL